MPGHYPPVGIFPDKDGSYFIRVWAPEKHSIDLVVLNGESRYLIPLTKDEFGYWTGTAELSQGVRYLYRIDGENEYADPASRYQPEGVKGPSEIVSSRFNWTDEGWKGIEPAEMIMYEIHTGTFSPKGNFEGVIERLPYLRELGINTIELMPIVQFPGERNWGYDGTFPFAVQNSYGGIQGLKKLVNAAHQEGIAVVLDVVYNHTGPEGSYLHHFAPYFIDKYRSPWGPVVNLDDEWSFGVRGFFLQNALLWLDECRVDGLRLDAVHAMVDNSAVHFMKELKGEVKKLEEQTGRRKILIAELDLNDPKYINSTEAGGFGMDAQWVDEFHHALHSALTGETSGYYSDFGSVAQLAKAYRDTYVYTGEFSQHRKRYFGTKVNNDFDRFIVFSQNHDHTGNRMLGERLSALTTFEGLKVAAAAVLLSPYIPLLFMGEEYGEKNPFLYFISHESEELIEAVRKGRKEEFKHFNWENEPPDPFNTETFRMSSPCWNCEEDDHAVLLSLYKRLIQLRKNKTALRSPRRETMKMLETENENIIAFERMADGERLLVAFNFGKEIEEIKLPRARWKKIFDSSESEWMGDGESTLHEDDSGPLLRMKPFSALLMEE